MKLSDFGRKVLRVWARRCGEHKLYVHNLHRNYRLCVRGRTRRWLRAWLGVAMRRRGDRVRVAEGRVMRGVRYLDNMQLTYVVRAWRWHVQGRRRRAVACKRVAVKRAVRIASDAFWALAFNVAAAREKCATAARHATGRLRGPLREWAAAASTARRAVGPGRYCPPRHPPHFETPFIALNGIQ